jgi:uncharacterized membrane protein YhaH (DUF805 family)
MSRAVFLACATLLVALAVAYEYGLARGLGFHAGWVFYPLLLFPTACVLSKRLHDRGLAGWWGFLVVWALIEVWPQPSNLFGYAAMAVLAVTFVNLGLMPGQPGPNRFGPNPVDRRRAPH